MDICINTSILSYCSFSLLPPSLRTSTSTPASRLASDGTPPESALLPTVFDSLPPSSAGVVPASLPGTTPHTTPNPDVEGRGPSYYYLLPWRRSPPIPPLSHPPPHQPAGGRSPLGADLTASAGLCYVSAWKPGSVGGIALSAHDVGLLSGERCYERLPTAALAVPPPSLGSIAPSHGGPPYLPATTMQNVSPVPGRVGTPRVPH